MNTYEVTLKKDYNEEFNVKLNVTATRFVINHRYSTVSFFSDFEEIAFFNHVRSVKKL